MMKDEESSDYKRGWFDGYHAATRNAKTPYDDLKEGPKPPYNIPSSFATACSVCGMAFVDSLGRPIAMGYVCPRYDCPSQARYASLNQGGIKA